MPFDKIQDGDLAEVHTRDVKSSRPVWPRGQIFRPRPRVQLPTARLLHLSAPAAVPSVRLLVTTTVNRMMDDVVERSKVVELFFAVYTENGNRM